MKKWSKFVKLILMMAVVGLLLGCGYSEEEKAFMKTCEDNAKVNAVDYVKNKYGFTAEVVGTRVLKADPGPVPTMSPSPTGMVNVSMKYGDKEFLVNISGEDYNTDGKDDYQKEEIAQVFADKFASELGITIASFDIRYTDNYFLTELFTDADSFLDSRRGNGIVSIVIQTLDEVSEETVENVNYDTVELLVISVRDQEGIEALSRFEYLNEQAYRLNFYNTDAMDRKLAEYSIYMNGHVFKSMEGDVDLKLYAVNQVADGVYFVCDKNTDASGVKIAETSDIAPATDWSRASGKALSYPTFENPKMVSKAYAVEFGELNQLQVYIKQDEKTEKDNATRYIAMQYVDADGREVFDHMATWSVEGYYTVQLEKQDELRIVVMINQK